MAFNISFKVLSATASLAGILMLLRSVVGEFFLESLNSQFFYLMFFTPDMFNIGPLALTLILLRIMPSELIPEQLRSHLFSILPPPFIPSSSNLTIVINECSGMSRNEVYSAAYLYLPTKISPKTERLGLSKTERQKHFAISNEKDAEMVDDFQGIQLRWKYFAEKKFFELSFNKKFRGEVFDVYLPHVLDHVKQLLQEDKVVQIYNRDCPRGNDDTGIWGSMILEHPATFDTVAVDPELKKTIIDDLKRFVMGREFYKKVGKAWKRVYLLYGPPGTEKSSLIAAMAKYLKFDIYNLDLASIYSNSDLRNVLLSTTNRSILVIEDIDCIIQVQGRENRWESDNSNRRLTLSGILNFIDGLLSLSSCGDEKIIVFTTNHKDRLEPALLRPGMMDVYIELSYCTVGTFRILASNYLDISNREHPLFGEIESLIQSTEVTPAEVAGELMRGEDADLALQGLVKFLKHKKSKIEEEVAEMEEANSFKSDNEEKDISVRRKRQRGVRIATRRRRGKGGTKD